MSGIPDAYDLWRQNEARLQAELDRRPRCGICNEPIQDDYLYEINDIIRCEGCLNKHFRKNTEDYIE